MSTSAATVAGFLAILLWGGLAALSTLAAEVPPFQTTAVAFLAGGALGIGLAVASGRARRLWPTLPSFLLGLYGLFIYHALYFAALRLAPPAEANLVASLWALVIVILSSFLPGGRLRVRHLLGALLGFGAAVLLVWPRLGVSGGDQPLLGLALAFGCALVWSTYSVASRLVAAAPTESVAVACLCTAVLAFVCHLVFETTVWPAGAAGWAGLVGLGIGPVGAAFYLWDLGMKRGDVSLLGVLSYAQPVIATGLLILIGKAEPSWLLGAAVALVVGGAAIATRRG